MKMEPKGNRPEAGIIKDGLEYQADTAGIGLSFEKQYSTTLNLC